MGKHIEVEFELISKSEVIEMVLSQVAYSQKKLKNARSVSNKKVYKETIRFFGSIAKHLDGLTESPKKKHNGK